MSATSSRSKRFVLGAGSGLLVQLATIVVGLVMAPISLGYLGAERYGIFTLANDILTWLALLDLGITAALVSHASQLDHKSESERLQRLVSTAWFAQLAIAGMVLLLGSGVAAGFGSFFRVSPEFRHEAWLTVLILVVGAAINEGCRTFSAVLVSAQQVHVDNAIKAVLIVSRAVITYILLVAGMGLLSLAIGNLVATCVTVTLWYVRARRLLPGLRLRRSYVSRETFAQITNLGFWFCIGLLAQLLIMGMDRVVAAKVLGVAFVTVLGITGRLYALTAGVLQQFGSTSQPMIGQLLGKGETERALQVSRQLFVLTAGLAVLMALSLFAGNEAFISSWVGRDYYGGWVLDALVALNMVVYAWVHSNRVVLMAAKVARPVTIARLAEGVLAIVLSIFLAHRFGLTGVVAGTTLAALLTSTWAIPYLVAKTFHRPLGELLWKDARRLLLLAGLVLPVAIGARALSLVVGGYLGAFVGASLTFLLGGAVLWFVAMDEGLRSRARDVFRKLRPARA